MLTDEEYHSAEDQRRRQGQLFGEGWKHLFQPALNTNLCNIISKVCLHQFIVLQWVVLPFLQLYWHGYCHSRDRSLGICRRCYDFFFSQVNWSSRGLEKSSKAFGSVTCLQSTVPILQLQNVCSERAQPGTSSGSRKNRGTGGQGHRGKAHEVIWTSRRLLGISTNNMNNENLRVSPVRVWKWSFFHHAFM